MTGLDKHAARQRNILQAASAVLAHQGLAATTINSVSAEAGLSRGLLHYYFKSKEDLLVGVAREYLQESLQVMARMFGAGETPAALAKELVSGLRLVCTHQPEFFSLLFELWAVARQSERVKDQLRSLYSLCREEVTRLLEDAAARGIISAQASPQGLAATLTAIFDGLALQVLVDEKLLQDAPLWQGAEEAIRLLLSCGQSKN